MNSRRIKVLIVDDEPLARQRIRDLLKGRPEISVIAEARNGQEAVELILEERPGLVFLDIQMPAMNGFEVIEAVGFKNIPATIFATAYDEFAVKAFEVHALDYLLKPYSRERFEKAVTRAIAEINRSKDSTADNSIESLMTTIKPERLLPGRIPVRVNSKIIVLKIEEIDWIEAAGNYVQLHLGRQKYLLRETMKGVTVRLSGRPFARIHRSTIVNLERIKELQPHLHGDYRIKLIDGTSLTMSRRYADQLEELIKKR